MNPKTLETAATVAKTAFEYLSKHPELLKDPSLSLPNVKLKVMNKKIFWTDLVEYKGWCIQQNTLTKHARILDANNYRVAWGTVDGMIRVLDRIIELSEKYGK